MAKIKAFKGVRPKNSLVEKVAELPYDVLNSKEAKEIVGDNPYSFFHVTKPEIDLPEGVNPYDDAVYKKGKENLDRLIAEGTLLQDSTNNLYLYTQVMNGKEQTGLVAAVSIDDYINNKIKKHELTREDKEQDRTHHLNTLNANTGPVFLLFKANEKKKELFNKAKQITPQYDFVAEDGVGHIFRVIADSDLISEIEKSFADDILYIADGHHRAASGANVGLQRRKANPKYTGEEEFNFFLSVIFSDDELAILPYNRALKDLNGLTEDEFIAKINENFILEKSSLKEPEVSQTFSMYFNREWFTLKTKFDVSSDSIDSLDVKILQDYILSPIFGIDDPRTNNRISFIGGIRGVKELEKLVDSKNYVVAFSMYPTTVQQLLNVADDNKIMPPKSTWFEPKLRSGLIVHLLD